MSDNADSPRFGEMDSEGFRAFTICDNDGAAVIKIFLHVDRFRDGLNEYSQEELDGLRSAAALAAARDVSPLKDAHPSSDVSLALYLPFVSTLIGQQIEKHFPALAMRALDIVAHACTKFAITSAVEMYNGPRIYSKEDAELLIQPFADYLKEGFLRVRAGRPSLLLEQLRGTQETLERLDRENSKPGHNWSPQEVALAFRPTDAENPTIQPSTISGWLRETKVNWEEWSRAARSLGN